MTHDVQMPKTHSVITTKLLKEKSDINCFKLQYITVVKRLRSGTRGGAVVKTTTTGASELNRWAELWLAYYVCFM